MLIKILFQFGYSGFEQLLFRGIFMGIISLVLSYYSSVSIYTLTKPELKFLKFRSFVIICIGIAMTICIGFMSASLVFLIINSSAIYTPLISRLFLKEKFNFLNIVAIFICFLGIIFLIQPSFIFGKSNKSDEKEVSILKFYLGILGLMITAILISSILVYTRVVMAKIHIATISIWYSVGLILVSAFGIFIPQANELYFEWKGILLLILFSVLAFLAHTFFYLAAKYEKPSICAVIMYSQVFFTYIAEIVFFGLELGIYDVVGGLLIAITTIAVSLQKLFAKE